MAESAHPQPPRGLIPLLADAILTEHALRPARDDAPATRRIPMRRLRARLPFLLLPALALVAGASGAAEPGPVGLSVVGDEAWVAFADRVLRVDLSWSSPPAVAATATGPDAKMKWVSTCEGCPGVVFVVQVDGATAIRWTARDGSGSPVELVAPDAGAHWKSVALGDGGARAWAADVKGDRVLELRIDPATGARLGDRRLAGIEAPYAVTWLGPEGLLVTTHDDRLRWLDLEGATRADWHLAAACHYESENHGPLRRALRDPTSGDLFALNHRSVLRIALDARREAIARCAVVAGDPGEAGFVDACGAEARFSHPHDLALVPDGSALLVSDTDDDVLRRVSLAPGDAGCVSTIPLHDVPPPASARSCGELGWPTRSPFDRDPGRCAGPPGDDACGEPVAWEEAQRRCEALGARLCTHFELAADEARGSGCASDDDWVWSATRCERVSPTGRYRWDTGAIAQAGASTGLFARPPTCRASGRARVRCCADAR